jgi:solute carrier family 10 (sodium/bile acid cotransporter), member 7
MNRMDMKQVKKLLLKYHLPLGLFVGVLFGYLVPKPGEFLADLDSGFYGMGISSLDIFIIFLISGLKLKTDDVKKALTSYRALIYGVFAILCITPCAAFGLVRLDGNLSVPEFAFGIAVFALMPTTLSSGVILTRDANGNVPISLMLTVVTNLSAVLILPFTIDLVFSSVEGLNVSIDPVPMIVKLLLSILVPLCIGKVLRDSVVEIAEFANTHGVKLKLFSSFCLVMVPWMKVSSSSDEMSQIDTSGIFEILGLGIALHLVYLIMNFTFVNALGFELDAKKSVVIMCSQKTLPVAVAIIDFLPSKSGDEGYLGEPGIMVIACILAHFVQIVIDAFVASYWSSIKDDDNKDNNKDIVVTDIVPDGPSKGNNSEDSGGLEMMASSPTKVTV